MLESLKQNMSASKLEYGGTLGVSCHFMELLVFWLFAGINYTTILQFSATLLGVHTLKALEAVMHHIALSNSKPFSPTLDQLMD